MEVIMNDEWPMMKKKFWKEGSEFPD